MAKRGNIPAGKELVGFYIDRAVAKRVRVAAAERGESNSALAERALRRELEMAEERRYDGWRIRTGFLAGNLMQNMEEAAQYDEAESAREYARLCREAIEREYPGAQVEIPFQLHTSGALPVNMTTRVFDPEGGDWEPHAYPHEGSQIAADVEEICGEVWQGMAWLVPKWASVDATQYVVIADEQVVYPVLRANLGPEDTPEALAAMDEEEYQRWCERVPADERFGDFDSPEMIAFCDWLQEKGAERWEISASGEYPAGRRG